MGSGANESSSSSAKYPIKRLHTWHFGGAGLRTASRKQIGQAQGWCPVTRAQEGRGPSDLGRLLLGLCPPLCADLRDWNIKEEFFALVLSMFLRGRAQKSPPAPTGVNPVPGGGCSSCLQTSNAGEMPFAVLKALAISKPFLTLNMYQQALFSCTYFRFIFIYRTVTRREEQYLNST